MTLTSTLVRGCLVLAATFLLALPATAQAPAWQWGLQSLNATPTDGSQAAAYAVVTDAAGRAYVGGTFGEDLFGGTVALRSFGSAGSLGPGRGAFVAQTTAASQWSWLSSLVASSNLPGTTPSVSVTDVAVSTAGDVYACGFVEGSSVLVGSLPQAIGSIGAGVFVVRLNAAGVCQWLRVVESSFTRPRLAADPSTGGVVLAGFYQGSPSFGSTTLPPGSALGNGSIFVARLSAAGQWLGAAASTGAAGVVFEINLAVGPAGQVAVASAQGPGAMSFGASTLTAPASTDESLVVAQLSPSNQWQWAVGGSGSNTHGAAAVAYTPAGTLWVSGHGANGTRVGPLTLVAPAGTGVSSLAAFLGQLSATGQWITGQQVSPSGSGVAAFGPLALDGAGNAIVMGFLTGFSGSVQASIGSQSLTTPATGGLLFLAGLSSAGQWRYAVTVPPTTLVDGLALYDSALDGSGNLYVAGGLRGGLTLGSTPLNGSSNGSATDFILGDAVLARLSNAALATAPARAAQPLACFPNPAHASAMLTLTPAAQARPLRVTDVLGREVRQLLLPAYATSAVLSLHGLAPGLYAVRCGANTSRLQVE